MKKYPLWKTIESAGTGNSADDFEPYFETYLIDDKKRRGGVLVLPGGGYCKRAPHEGEPVALKFNELGLHAFVLQYRVAPYRYPAPQRDLFRAIKIIRCHAAEWGLIPDQLAVLGFSAGGHLTASGATLYDEVAVLTGDEADGFSARPDAVIPCYPVINLTSPWGNRGSGVNLLGEEGMARREAEELNLETRVTSYTPPAFLWHTADDPVVNIKNSTSFAEALWKHGVAAELHVFPHGPHGIGLAEDYPDASRWPKLAARFLETTCKFTARKN